MDRVFLDANVLFSAAYLSDSGLLRLWKIRHAKLTTSVYAVHEAMVNLPSREQKDRLNHLLMSVELTPEQMEIRLPADIALPESDRPILQGAIAAKATHLLTGDKAYFGQYYARKVEGVLILPPAEYPRKHHQKK